MKNRDRINLATETMKWPWKSTGEKRCEEPRKHRELPWRLETSSTATSWDLAVVIALYFSFFLWWNIKFNILLCKVRITCKWNSTHLIILIIHKHVSTGSFLNYVTTWISSHNLLWIYFCSANLWLHSHACIYFWAVLYNIKFEADQLAWSFSFSAF